ncbi:hypothetical protein VQ056_02090 [Paenibacillus sp. JTLBN-2024]
MLSLNSEKIGNVFEPDPRGSENPLADFVILKSHQQAEHRDDGENKEQDDAGQ